MSVDQVLQALQQATSSADKKLLIDGDAEFRRSLTIGQIIKGKVLRHYEGSKYLVDFSGEQKVVDSQMKLMDGASIQGRVTGLSEKVTLQRIMGQTEVSPIEKQTANRSSGTDDVSFQQWMTANQLTLSPNQQSMLLRAIQMSGEKGITLTAALLVIKSGWLLSSGTLALAESVLKNGKLNLPASQLDQALFTLVNAEQDMSDTMQPNLVLAEFIRGVVSQKWQRQTGLLPTWADSVDGGDKHRHQEEPAAGSENLEEHSRETFSQATWLMNSQVEGTVAHRAVTIPIWIGDRLQEFTVSLFSQNDRERAALNGSRYQKVVLSLDTEHLGKVEVVANLVNNRVKLSLSAEAQNAVEELARHNDRLARSLGESWVVDEISYTELANRGSDGAISAAAAHIVSQESLSRLM